MCTQDYQSGTFDEAARLSTHVDAHISGGGSQIAIAELRMGAMASPSLTALPRIQ